MNSLRENREKTNAYIKMAEFLSMVKEETVKKVFENIESKSEMFAYRMKYLKNSYESFRQ